MYAQYLFKVEFKYMESVLILEKLNASPLDVIELYPDFFGENTNEIASCTDAVVVLGEYLHRERYRLMKYRTIVKNSDVSETRLSVFNFDSDGQGQNQYSDALQLSEFVDNMLLKAYVTIQSPLLGSFLKNETFCNREFTEMILRSNDLIANLIDFLKSRGFHRDCIELIFKSGLVPDEMTRGVNYLQDLNPNEHMDIILEYSNEPLVF
jgi:hypothetical protein